MLEKSKVLANYIELQEGKIELLKKTIIQLSEDISRSREKNDSQNDIMESQCNSSIKVMEESLRENMEILSKLKLMQIVCNNKITFGSLVKIKNINTGDLNIYFIICPGGDLLNVDENKIITISFKAPFTKALFNKKEQDEIVFMDQKFKVLAIQ
ncbi:GreA/GreB family elongation factor [Patescibacteria group bacterium]|nr:GreA/GreB family elongation factor [Patescibacteria group bacterium]